MTWWTTGSTPPRHFNPGDPDDELFGAYELRDYLRDKGAAYASKPHDWPKAYAIEAILDDLFPETAPHRFERT